MAAMYEMKHEESKKAILYLVTGVACIPISIKEKMFNVMAADVLFRLMLFDLVMLTDTITSSV